MALLLQKRGNNDKQNQSRGKSSETASKGTDYNMGMSDLGSLPPDEVNGLASNQEPQSLKPKRPKRQTKSVSESMEPAIATSTMPAPQQSQNPPSNGMTPDAGL